MKKTERQIRREQRQAEHWATKRAVAPDPQSQAAVEFDRLRATIPRHDARWARIRAALTEFAPATERTS
jgi:ferric-dicitrate binding protein FerR (iron transport regulator)